jgi:hypothetical protein
VRVTHNCFCGRSPSSCYHVLKPCFVIISTAPPVAPSPLFFPAASTPPLIGPNSPPPVHLCPIHRDHSFTYSSHISSTHLHHLSSPKLATRVVPVATALPWLPSSTSPWPENFGAAPALLFVVYASLWLGIAHRLVGFIRHPPEQPEHRPCRRFASPPSSFSTVVTSASPLPPPSSAVKSR